MTYNQYQGDPVLLQVVYYPNKVEHPKEVVRKTKQQNQNQRFIVLQVKWMTYHQYQGDPVLLQVVYHPKKVEHPKEVALVHIGVVNIRKMQT